VYHAGEEGGRLYVTMRFVEGTDLRALLAVEGPLGATRAVTLTRQVADALDDAHAHGLVHRDVKPANVLIGTRGGAEHAYLTDFGVSKQRRGSLPLTGTGLAIGTADYIAPEQAQGREIDARADVYALACVLFEALTGRIPFEGDGDLEKLWAHVHESPPDLAALRPDLPRALGAAIATALAKDPEQRQQSAGAFAREVVAAAAAQPS
jgi:serine/threonine protein kinase